MKVLKVTTDHKPSITLFGKKEVDKIPIRIQRYRLRLMRYVMYHYSIYIYILFICICPMMIYLKYISPSNCKSYLECVFL